MANSELTVSVQATKDGTWRLMVTSSAGTAPAGNRLARGEALAVDWEHFDKEAADDAADILQRYIDDNHGNQRKQRKRHQT